MKAIAARTAGPLLQRRPSAPTRTPSFDATPTFGVPAIVRLQHAVGNRAMARAVAPRLHQPAIQRKCAECEKEHETIRPKLAVGPADDDYECEADRVADHVMRMPDPVGRVVQRAPAIVQRVCKKCEEEDKKLQGKTAGAGGLHVSQDVESQIASLKGAGHPLPESARSYFEPRFGQDFGRVRLHTGARAAEAARSIGALAFTVGRDVAFAAGQYAPETSAGRRLLAHELVHTVQQGGYRGTASAIQPIAQPLVQRAGDPAQAPAMTCPLATTTSAFPTAVEVLFPSEASTLTPAQQASIQAFTASWQAAGASTPVRVDGYASVDGSQNLNWRLSCQRAESVKAELEHPSNGSPGVTPGLITFFANGETSEFGPAIAQNRRANINAAAAPPPNPTCANGRPRENRISGCVQPIVVAENDGSSPLVAPSMAAIARIWGKCCLDFTVNSTMTVNNSTLKEIDDAGSGAPMIAEETALFAPATGGGCVPVGVVDTIRRGATASKMVAGGATTKDTGTSQPKVVVVEGADPNVVAHEVGHALTCQHSDDVGGATIMNPTGSPFVANPEGVTANICNKARTAPVLLATAADLCCEDTA